MGRWIGFFVVVIVFRASSVRRLRICCLVPASLSAIIHRRLACQAFNTSIKIFVEFDFGVVGGQVIFFGSHVFNGVLEFRCVYPYNLLYKRAVSLNVESVFVLNVFCFIQGCYVYPCNLQYKRGFGASQNFITFLKN